VIPLVDGLALPDGPHDWPGLLRRQNFYSSRTFFSLSVGRASVVEPGLQSTFLHGKGSKSG
jgi:hypothetical protein